MKYNLGAIVLVFSYSDWDWFVVANEQERSGTSVVVDSRYNCSIYRLFLCSILLKCFFLVDRPSGQDSGERPVCG